MEQTIETGIGRITYITENSLDLVLLMEALDERIKKYGVKKVIELLQDNQYEGTKKNIVYGKA